MSRSVTLSAVAFISKFVFKELKASGFRRGGNHLYRPSHDVFHGVHFQASQWNSAQSGDFTISLVVTSPFVYEAWTGKPLPANPASALFPVQERIGRLMPGHTGWWLISESTDQEAVGHEVLHALTTYGLPFFDQYPDSDAILERLRQGAAVPGLPEAQRPLIQAALALAKGHRDEAADLIRQALLRSEGSGFQKTVQLIGGRLGLLESELSG